MDESGSLCDGAFRLESRAEKAKGEVVFRFRCMGDGCRRIIETALVECTDMRGNPSPAPPLGRLYLLRIRANILEIREVNSVDG